MSLSALYVGTFARSLCWSPAGPDTARPHLQTIKSKLQSIAPPTLKTVALVNVSLTHRFPQPQRARPAASSPAFKSP